MAPTAACICTTYRSSPEELASLYRETAEGTVAQLEGVCKWEEIPTMDWREGELGERTQLIAAEMTWRAMMKMRRGTVLYMTLSSLLQ